MAEVEPAVQRILALRKTAPPARSVLVGISGIDGSGKGFCAARIDQRLKAEGVRSAAINVDGWLNPPSKRFGPDAPAEHFYRNGIRFAEMFAQLVLPLKERRSLRLTAELTDPTNAEGFQPFEYEFHDLDVILLEGIFLFKREHRDALDLAVWIDCSFETALERALARGQEGLPPEEAVRDYETIYFPAQRLHFERDDPRGFAQLLLVNDPRM